VWMLAPCSSTHGTGEVDGLLRNLAAIATGGPVSGSFRARSDASLPPTYSLVDSDGCGGIVTYPNGDRRRSRGHPRAMSPPSTFRRTAPSSLSAGGGFHRRCRASSTSTFPASARRRARSSSPSITTTSHRSAAAARSSAAANASSDVRDDVRDAFGSDWDIACSCVLAPPRSSPLQSPFVAGSDGLSPLLTGFDSRRLH